MARGRGYRGLPPRLSTPSSKMVVRCILGCAPPQVLFAIPKQPRLRVRWLQFLHFEEGGITANTRLCARHFTEECFKNLRRYEVGLVQILHLTETAVPSVYTAGTSTNVKVSKTIDIRRCRLFLWAAIYIAAVNLTSFTIVITQAASQFVYLYYALKVCTLFVKKK